MLKITKILWYAFLLNVFSTINVNAYIDPSVTTYAIQAIAGVLIGLSAFLNIYWRKIARKLKVEGTYKENEQDYLYFDDPVSEARITVGKDSRREEFTDDHGNVSFIKDGLLALCVSFALIYLLFTYGPIEIYSNNMQEFWFDIYIMMRSLVPVFFFLMAAVVTVLLVIRKKNRRLFIHFCSVMFALFLIFYIQGNFLVYHMPAMDGRSTEWSQYIPDMFISTVMTAAVCCMVWYGRKALKERMNKVITFISGLLSAVLVITTISIPFTTNVLDRKLHYIVTDNENMVLGNEKNFLILLLDAVDSRNIQQEYTANPGFYEETFRDFMYYPNTSGAYSFTQEAVPFIMNGKWFENQEDFFDFERRAMSESPLLKRMEEEQYRIDYYDHDLLYITAEEDMQRFHNVYHYDTRFRSSLEYTLVQLRLTLFKYAPFYLKPFISYNLKAFPDLRKIPEGMVANTFYYSDRALYLQLQNEGFHVDPGLKRAFKFYHLDGAHVPFDYDEDLNIIESGTGSYETNVRVSMKVAAEFLHELKETGMYDQTAVIIIADHGYANQGFAERGNPLLMVKGFNEQHDFTISRAPISFEDLQDLYASLLDGKTGEDQFVWKEGDQRVRRFLGYLFNKEYEITEYHLEGDASRIDLFYPTGKMYILGQNADN